MSALAAELPPLPLALEGEEWSCNIQNGYNVLCELYEKSRRIVLQDDVDPVQLKLLSEKVFNDSLPILEGMEQDGVPTDWVHTCAHTFGPLIYELEMASLAAEGYEHQKIALVEPVEVVTTAKRGRPRKIPDPTYLREATSKHRNISFRELAATLHMHRNVL
ncbi:hypothetical protein NEOLEDRAFT_1182072 [Neolentinus lepideus HHB14362 ss-1]|uniref:Uncharacterized protein n=1 Tax=Neolentinus lepideus HHB14362 ss-1 TaxID=1314782 RepID=A0A165PG92_9AGAM|nr:hypothetical protein NEOLEDRAFT_1182072 [Neolentinus lepideus HHB14362 ss-1]